MILKVERGRGYRAATQRPAFEEQSGPIGRLQLDASFSPVHRVTYDVEAARVEQRTDLDKLIIDIETNGTIDPEEAIRRGRQHPERPAVLSSSTCRVRTKASALRRKHQVESDLAASGG